MPVLVLKALDCDRTHGVSDGTELRVTVGSSTTTIVMAFHYRERAVLERSIHFEGSVSVELVVAGTIRIGDTLAIQAVWSPHLSTHGTARRGFHRGAQRFAEAAARYTLWYEVIPDGMAAPEFHRSALASAFTLRQFFGRLGRGALTAREHERAIRSDDPYRCSEVISLREMFELHRPQDGRTGRATSIREWIRRHGNVWGEESVIPISQLPVGPKPIEFVSLPPQWRPVTDERSKVLAGVVTRSYMSGEDLPDTHRTRDYLFNVVPSPQFAYLLAYTAKSIDVTNESFEPTPVPLSHNEWESGSMPTDWRPVVGEYVTIWGRHVFDIGHLPMTTELHPMHTIVRERTLGEVNRITIGMGLSGGFPASTQEQTAEALKPRWDAEFGGYLAYLTRRNRRCWPTNLKKHPLSMKLFPPNRRPSPQAEVSAKLLDWKIIKIRRSQINDFLKACSGAASATDPVNRSFEEWFPQGLEVKPVAPRPLLSSKGNHCALTIDLTIAEDIPVAYFAVIDVRWT